MVYYHLSLLQFFDHTIVNWLSIVEIQPTPFRINSNSGPITLVSGMALFFFQIWLLASNNLPEVVESQCVTVYSVHLTPFFIPIAFVLS